jgi:hypothetical protein
VAWAIARVAALLVVLGGVLVIMRWRPVARG